jgi:hypothetical protein
MTPHEQADLIAIGLMFLLMLLAVAVGNGWVKI